MDKIVSISMPLSVLFINPILYQLSISDVSTTTENNGVAPIVQGILLLLFCFSKVNPSLR